MKKQSFFSTLVYLFTVFVVLQSCEDHTLDNSSTSKTTQQTKEWINNTLRNVYLWNDEVKEKDPNYNLSVEDLFYSLLSRKDGKDSQNGGHYYYSTIKSKNSETRAINSESTYGFEFALYYKSESEKDIYHVRVLYVIPQSPASKAGLKRGDWITSINNNPITEKNYRELYNGPEIKISIDDKSELTLEASYKIDENPLLLDTIYEIEDKKIGYLVYNQFATGPDDDHNDKTYDNQMKNIFNNKFSKENPDEFILDLRYNGGGYLSCGQLLAGLIVSEKHKNDVFCISRDNKNTEYKYNFTNGGSHLNISRIFVLVSSQTASASEAVINGLKPYMEVILIGTETEGKNVGSEKIEENGYEWYMQPIMVQIYNKNKESDYENGFVPDYELDELKYANMYQLGDTREVLLKEALSKINGINRLYSKNTTEQENLPLIITYSSTTSLSKKQANAVIMDK